MIEPMDPTQQNKQSSQLSTEPQAHKPEVSADVTTQPPSAWHTVWQKIEGPASLALFIGGVFGAAMLINQFIFQAYYVDGTSMTPTLHNNDRLIIDKFSKTLAAVQSKPYIPERGQIVVLDSSLLDQNGNNEQLIKRVVGLPGDIIDIKDGVVTIKNSGHPDGFNLDSSLGLKLAPTYSIASTEITVPKDEVFVMGDNRAPNGSFDSRSFGPIDSKKIQGRLLARIYPFSDGRLF
ncbi:MAG TPA: signal peptidase I [Patescibacteria group bacterium]|jgi:signal peptidase I|nr:signal peptidase I [Patescibacteria group bacterium]